MVTAPPDIAIFDRALLRRHRGRATKNYPDFRFLTDWADAQLADRLTDVTRNFPCALQIGANSAPGLFSNTGKIGSLTVMDTGGKADVIADEEFLPFADHSFDLAYSALRLHSVNDLPGALIQLRRALKPDGFFLAALFGGETLFELRKSLMQAEMDLRGGASPRVFPFADKPQMGALMQRAGFALPVVDSEIITVTYENIFSLMRDLRGMGESNVIAGRHKMNPGRSLFVRAQEYYAREFSEPGGRLCASFEIIFLAGWAPHASQQKPLAPGSAKTRLAEALETREIKTGAKARP